MVALILSLLGALGSALRTRANLALENLALRQQLANLRRTSSRPRLSTSDRAFWLVLSTLGWKELGGRRASGRNHAPRWHLLRLRRPRYHSDDPRPRPSGRDQGQATAHHEVGRNGPVGAVPVDQPALRVVPHVPQDRTFPGDAEPRLRDAKIGN